MTGSFDPYYTWLGIAPDEQPPDHYRLLGIRRFESNEEVIVNASDQRMAHLRTYQSGKHSKDSQRLLNEIAAAQRCLLQPVKKQIYDDQLRSSAQSKHSLSLAIPEPVLTGSRSPQPPQVSFHSAEPRLTSSLREPMPLRDSFFDAQVSGIPVLPSHTARHSNSPFILLITGAGALFAAVIALAIFLRWPAEPKTSQIATTPTERIGTSVGVSEQESPDVHPSVQHALPAAVPVPPVPRDNPKAAAESVSQGPTAPTTVTFTEEETRAALSALQELGLQLPSDAQAANFVRTANSKFTAEHAPLLAKLPALNSLDLRGSVVPDVVGHLPACVAISSSQLIGRVAEWHDRQRLGLGHENATAEVCGSTYREVNACQPGQTQSPAEA